MIGKRSPRRRHNYPEWKKPLPKEEVKHACPFCGAFLLEYPDALAHEMPSCEAFDATPAPDIIAKIREMQRAVS